MMYGEHVLIPGSFDPMTLGHADLIRRVAENSGRVTVAVMINREKQYLFDLPTRVRIAEATLAGIPNVSVIGDSGMLIDLFDRIGADVVCKSYRNADDLAYEKLQAEWNEAHNPRFRTCLIPAEGNRCDLSATEVRKILHDGKIPDGLVAPEALPLILSEYRKSRPD